MGQSYGVAPSFTTFMQENIDASPLTWDDVGNLLGYEIDSNKLKMKVYHHNQKAGTNFQWKRGGIVAQSEADAFLIGIGRSDLATKSEANPPVQKLSDFEQQIERLERDLNAERYKCSDLNEALSDERSKLERLEQQRLKLERDLNSS